MYLPTVYLGRTKTLSKRPVPDDCPDVFSLSDPDTGPCPGVLPSLPACSGISTAMLALPTRPSFLFPFFRNRELRPVRLPVNFL